MYARCWREQKLIMLIMQLLYGFYFVHQRVCRKASLIQECLYLPSSPWMFWPSGGVVMEILLHHLLFSLSPVLYHEPRSHGGTWLRGTGWLRPSLSRPFSLSLGSHCSPRGRLTLALCSAVDAGDSQVAPDANMCDITSNICYLCKIRSRFSHLTTLARVPSMRLHMSLV